MQNLLRELEQYKKTHYYVFNISRKTGEFLYQLIKKYKSKNIIEIGTSNGYSALWLAKQGANVITIEFDKEKIELAEENFKKSGLDNIILIFGDAKEEIKKLKQKFDFVFIDATKEEYMEYLRLLLPKLKKGAVVAAHNVVSLKDKLKDYLEFVKRNFKTKTMEEFDLEITII